jgi:FMN phosphatase YigB (HAD superfamily)
MRLFLLSTLATLVVAVESAPAIPMYTPQNLIIATDLDDVVLRRRNGRITVIVLKNMFKLKAMYTMFCENKKIAGNSTGERYGEGFYLYLLQRGEYKLAKIVKKVNTCKRLDKKTAQIMQRITEKNYTLFTATNIGSIFFKKLQKKFPDIFNDSCIKHGMTVDFTKAGIVKKPDPAYFEELKAKLNPSGDKYILFIDDKLENVKAARNAGLLAIHYINHKQLLKALHSYDICVCP